MMTGELLDNDSGPHFLALGMSGAPALEGFAVSQERGIRIRSYEVFCQVHAVAPLPGIDNDLRQQN